MTVLAVPMFPKRIKLNVRAGSLDNAGEKGAPEYRPQTGLEAEYLQRQTTVGRVYVRS